jgi:hypothetical protein
MWYYNYGQDNGYVDIMNWDNTFSIASAHWLKGGGREFESL